MWAVLQCFGFGEHFVSMIKILYHSPAASVITGNIISPSFPLQRGTRQGCPLSPLLFCLSLEPLAQAIRKSEVSIKIHDHNHSISLYADDIILYLDHFDVSVSSIIKEFDNFSSLSGYKINWSKSALMPINNVKVNSSIPSFIPIKESFIYLGITISLQGRISTVKMNLLPRFNFFFSMLPLSPPPGYFKEINSIISKFIWNDKCPRIKLTTLQHPNSTGGLAVPNFELYYWSFQLKALHNWVDPQSTVSWRVIEADKVKPNRLQDILFTGTGKKGDNYKFGPVVANSIKIWKTVERRIGGPFKFCNSTPLWHNFNFVCGNRPFVQPSWSSLGVNTCGDIQVYDDQGLCSFQTLRARFCLPASASFVFLQLRSALKAYGVPWSSSISSHPMQDWIAPSACRPSVSLIYLYTKIIDCITKPLSIKTIWNSELSDLNLSVDWERVWSNLSLTSKNLAHRLIHFKVIHRAYITPYKRFKMKLQSNLNCHICNTASSGTFLHMFWECPVVISLWTHVNLVLSSLLRIDWSVNPSLCLLNDDSGLCISSMQKRMLFAGFTAAKKTIIQNWFTPHMCRKTYWIRSLLQKVTCECATARVGGAKPSNIDAWQCFLFDIRDCMEEWLVLCFYCPSLSPSLLTWLWAIEYMSVVLLYFGCYVMLCVKKKKCW